ncbi:MAG: thioesterase family protein [Ginsengibacter sp.]
MFTKEFEIRWSDIDANHHLANAAYVNFMSHTRMAFLIENGLSQSALVKYNLGPVVFFEHIYYFKEVMLGKPVTVSLQLKGLSEDGQFFEFLHNIYDYKGRNCARCIMLGSWIDLTTRKLVPLPPEVFEMFNSLEHADDFKILTKNDTRFPENLPKNLPG